MLRAHSIDPARIKAIGCHGQTVAHAREDQFTSTLQIGDTNVLAKNTGITAVNDFRRRDMAAGRRAGCTAGSGVPRSDLARC